MKEQLPQDRRSFLKAMGGTTAVIAAVPVIFKSSPAQAAGAPEAAAAQGGGRSYTAGKYALELDGFHAGWVSEVDGGHATADVVVEKLGGDHIQRKHISGVKYEDITITCGAGMSQRFYNWIQDSFDHKASRKNGAIIAADFNFKEVARLTFHNALITEIGLPALDAASKDAAKMTVKFAPEYTRRQPAASSTALPGTGANNKTWLPSNFKLEIAGLDCSRVNKIESLTVKQKVTENAVGEQRDYELEPAHLEIPNLVITLPEANADTFFAWHEDFVIRGMSDSRNEKTGTLSWLGNNGSLLGSLKFSGLGIFKCAPDKMEAGADNIRRTKAEMYCEDIKFEYKASWA